MKPFYQDVPPMDSLYIGSDVYRLDGRLVKADVWRMIGEERSFNFWINYGENSIETHQLPQYYLKNCRFTLSNIDNPYCNKEHFSAF